MSKEHLHNERRTTHAALKDLHKAHEEFKKARAKLSQEIQKVDDPLDSVEHSGLGIDFKAERLKDKLKIRYAELSLTIKGASL